MSTPIEDRLSAALDARADQVTADDLRPLEVPAPAHRVSRGAVVALSVAAVTVAIAVPFAIARVGGDNHGSGPTLPGPTTTAPTATQTTDTYVPPANLRNVKVVARQAADVDGDGRPDQVRLYSGRLPHETFGGWVEVTLASGGSSRAAWPDGYTPDLVDPFSIGRDGLEQVLLSQSGGDEAQLLVYTWLDHGLVGVTKASNAPLALGLGEGKYADYYTDPDGLHSWLRGKPAHPPGWPVFHVRVWTWTLDGDQLTAQSDGSACVDVTSEDTPGGCP
jgi:hypothetical protein